MHLEGNPSQSPPPDFSSESWQMQNFWGEKELRIEKMFILQFCAFGSMEVLRALISILIRYNGRP